MPEERDNTHSPNKNAELHANTIIPMQSLQGLMCLFFPPWSSPQNLLLLDVLLS